MYEILEQKNPMLSRKAYFEAFSEAHKSNDEIDSNFIVMNANKHNVSYDIIMFVMSSNWDDTLATGINNIDKQNKEIFRQINQFLFKIKEEKSKKEIIEALNLLEECVIKYFNEEEAIQKQHNYSKYNMQHIEHKKLKDGIKNLRDDLESQEISPFIAINMHKDIFQLYRKHIMNLDKDFGTFLIKKYRS